MTTHPPSASRQIARAASKVMLAFVFRQAASLARQVLTAQAFGTGPEMEAFNVANQVVSTLFNLVAGGALASAFIPNFTQLFVQDQTRNAWKLASSVANWILLILTLASALAALFAPQIVRYGIAPDFVNDPVKEALTISLMRLMMPSALVFGLSGLVMGILNSRQVFLVPALAPAMYQAGLIIGVVVFSDSLGIYGLAWGVLLGAGLHLAVQIPTLLRQRPDYIPSLGLTFEPLHEVLRLLGPRLLGVGVVELNFWVNKRLASGMQVGSITAIEVAFRLMLIPQAIIAQSIAIASMPTLAAQFARGQMAEVRQSLADSLRGVLLLSLPASLGLMILRRPLVAMLLERGMFDERSTELVAWALLWAAAGLVGHSVVEVLARAFYALHDTRTPVAVGAAAMLLNVIFSYLFSAVFFQIGWEPLGGLTLANSLATSLEAGGLLWLIRRRLGGLHGRQVAAAGLQALAAGLVMAGAVWWWALQSAGRPTWWAGLGGAAVGGMVYAGAVLAVGVPEARRVLRAVFGRLQSRLRRKR